MALGCFIINTVFAFISWLYLPKHKASLDAWGRADSSEPLVLGGLRLLVTLGFVYLMRKRVGYFTLFQCLAVPCAAVIITYIQGLICLHV